MGIHRLLEGLAGTLQFLILLGMALCFTGASGYALWYYIHWLAKFPDISKFPHASPVTDFFCMLALFPGLIFFGGIVALYQEFIILISRESGPSQQHGDSRLATEQELRTAKILPRKD